MNTDVIFHRRFIVTGALVLFSVLFLGLFSQSGKVNPFFQTFLVSITFFLVVPVLYSKIVLEESLKNWGWQEGKMFLGMLVGMLSVAVAFGLIFVLTRTTAFSSEYFFPVTVQTHFGWFLVYELVVVAFTALLYEVFFRGLIQLLWLRSFGLWAVLFQALFVLTLLFLTGDISWQRAPLILFSPFAGLIAYFSQSIWYSWGASFLFFFLTDIFLLVIH